MRALVGLMWVASAAAQAPDVPAYVLPPARMAFRDTQDPMGSRLFRTTLTRTQVNLAGWWDFAADPKDAGEAARWFERFPAPEAALWVPGSWNAEARYWQYVGAGWHRRTFELPADGNARIHFSGVFYRAKVWLDGTLLGEHEGAYLPFDFVVRGLRKGPHSLVVRADNHLNELTLPKRNVDWFPFGGIDRPVYVELVPDVFIERFSVAAADGRPTATLALRNDGPAIARAVVIEVNGRPVGSETRQIAAGRSSIQVEFTVNDPVAWTPEAPNLYSARAVVGNDDQFTRFGIRTVAVKGADILWNGQRIRLRGVNRHDDHPEWGPSAPPRLLRQDVEIIKRLGANAVRSHYPPAEMFLDYCDEAGLLFLDEVPSWQYRTEQLGNPALQEKIEAAFRGMVERDGGHASVLSWSLGNEWPEPDRSYAAIEKLVKFARSVDRERLITFITGGATPWRVHELVDVIAVNWAKYQWYDPFTALDAVEGAKSVTALTRLHERYPEKPIILTEFGGAESQAGWHNWGNAKWSEEFQARNVEDSARFALETPWMSGGCVWQFTDTRTAPERFLAGRLHGWNAKGIVDAQRAPKLAFYRLQDVYRARR
jgi:beta-glucuronidase